MRTSIPITNGSPAGGVRRSRAGAWRRRGQKGYLLLELILALIVFSVAIVGLAKSANMAVKIVGSLSRENDIRLGLDSFLEEVRRKPVAEMKQTTQDERLGVTYQSTVDELTLKNVSGTVLRDLYKLRVSAIAEGEKEEDAIAVEVWVYKPATEAKQ
jgi:hypothetical protein